jgi:hypothetical protein
MSADIEPTFAQLRGVRLASGRAFSRGSRLNGETREAAHVDPLTESGRLLFDEAADRRSLVSDAWLLQKAGVSIEPLELARHDLLRDALGLSSLARLDSLVCRDLLDSIRGYLLAADSSRRAGGHLQGDLVSERPKERAP